MAFKRINYDSGEAVFEIIVRDTTGVPEKWKFMKSDASKVLSILNEKYNLGLIIRRRNNNDLEWAGI